MSSTPVREGRARSRPDPADLVSRARNGEPRAVAQLISLVENGGPLLPEVAAELAPYSGRAQVVGLTGAPGVGKSTATSALVRALRLTHERVGVLAVDPSSPFSGGALLGDRVRMGEHATDEGVFIRSMATRGRLGGLAWSTPHALRVLDAAGCEVVLIETVGVGQSEIDVVSLADTTVVLMAPGMGDGIQAAKAGILEIADVFVVNKADRDGAAQTVRDLRYMVSLADREATGGWKRPIVRTVAARGEGIDDLVTAIANHRAWLDTSGERARRRVARAESEVREVALRLLGDRMSEVDGAASLPALARKVASGGLDPYRAADQLIKALGS